MASLPGVGKHTALRYVLHLLHQSPQDVEAFVSSLSSLRNEVQYCRRCYNISDSELCPVCSSFKRDQQTICVVADVQDVMSIERTGLYTGVYHVLGGVISPIDGIGPQDLTTDALLARGPEAKEIILALPATIEGDTTCFYIYRRLSQLCPDVRVSQIARGVAVGGDLEYTDSLTLGRALSARTEFKS